MTRPRTDSPATAFAVALIEEFLRLGVRDIVLGPGSRSQALALAAAEFERLGLVRLRVRIDERVGGFLALGLAVETGVPVIIITTSGTAVANLHPAVLEAHHSGVPLIVVTADRPEALRGVGSNQTTDQPGIFSTAVAASWDVAPPSGAPGERDAAAQLARDAFAAASGPVHLNLAFAEPLSSPFTLTPPLSPAEPAAAVPPAVPPASPLASPLVTHGLTSATPVDTAPNGVADPQTMSYEEAAAAAGAGAGGAARERGSDGLLELATGPGTIVVAGTGAGPRAEEVARELGAPLLAEVSSGAHFGPNLVVAYRELLGNADFADRVERVIVFGHPTLSREVPALIQTDGVQTVVVRSRSAEDYNPGRRVQAFADAVRVTGEPAGREWSGSWVAASRSLIEPIEVAPDVAADASTHAKTELAAVRAPVTRRALVEAVWRATWPHDRLVLGASRLIREADKIVTGKRISVHANRGLAGIDGTISTALGIALASQAPGVVRAASPANAEAVSKAKAEVKARARADVGARADPDVAPSGAAAGTTRVLLGDLTFLHDVGALLFGVGEERPRIQVIVGNDNGGTIFDGLEVGRQGGPAFDRVLLTPQHAPVEQLARAYGWDYLRVETRGALDQALTASTGPTVIEVPLPRE